MMGFVEFYLFILGMGGMVKSGGWVGSSETRDKLGGLAEVALVGVENDRI